jgi:hypothetical protein
VFLIAGALFALFIRRRRKRSYAAWRRDSQSTSLVAASSDHFAVLSAEQPDDKSMPAFPPTTATATYAAAAPGQQRFSYESSLLESKYAYASPPRERKTADFDDTAVFEVAHLRSESLDSEPEYEEPRSRPHSDPDMPPGLQTARVLSIALIAGRGSAIGPTIVSSASSIKGPFEVPRSASRSPLAPSPVFVQTDRAVPGTPTEDRKTVKRKPLPKTDGAQADSRFSESA